MRKKLRQPASREGVLTFGDTRVDGCFPPHENQRGLPLSALHEIGATGRGTETGELPAAFAAVLIARISSCLPVLWIAPCADLYPPGLPELDPARLVLARSADDFSTVAAMEIGLHEGGLAAVVGEVGRLDRIIARRLQLACQRHGVAGFCLRRWPYGQPGENPEASAAVTRWLLTPAPSIHPGKEPGAARWHVALTHVRGGKPGKWLMEVGGATNSLRVVAALADHTTTTSPDPEKTSGYG